MIQAKDPATFKLRDDPNTTFGISAAIITPKQEIADENTRGITLYWSLFSANGGFPLGDNIALPKDESFSLSFDFSAAKPGEVDLLLGIRVYGKLSSEFLLEKIGPLANIIPILFLLLKRDFLVPLGREQITEKKDDKSYSGITDEIPVTVIQREKPKLSADDIDSVLKTCIEIISTEDQSRLLRTALACKRFTRALTESDIVDKYCDFWECCEFLTRGIYKKGTIETYVSRAISECKNEKIGFIQKGIVKDIYGTRKNLVHDAIENPSEIHKKIDVLEDIAMTLLRKSLGLAIEPTKALDAKIASLKAN